MDDKYVSVQDFFGKQNVRYSSKILQLGVID